MPPRIRCTAILLAAAGAALGSFAATATPDQPPPLPQHGPGGHGPRFDPERRLARLATELDLTTDQQAKLRPIFAAEAEELKVLDATALTGEQRRERTRELRTVTREMIAAVLTPEQRQKLAALRPRGPHGRQDGQTGGPPPPPPATGG